MRKITIIGSGGSGKTTLATHLSRLLSLPVYHLDALYWQPGWVKTEKKEWTELQISLCKEPQWIIDGNYGSTMDIRLNSSDTIIYLDMNRYLCLFRVMKRMVQHFGKTRSDMGLGCKEGFDAKFLSWIYRYPIKKRPELLQELSVLNETVDVYVLKNKREVEGFLADVTKNTSTKLLPPKY